MSKPLYYKDIDFFPRVAEPGTIFSGSTSRPQTLTERLINVGIVTIQGRKLRPLRRNEPAPAHKLDPTGTRQQENTAPPAAVNGQPMAGQCDGPPCVVVRIEDAFVMGASELDDSVYID